MTKRPRGIATAPGARPIRSRISGGLLAAGLCLLLAGCSLFPGWGGRGSAYPEDSEEAVASPVFVTAVPSYRLLVDPTSADAPSRLLVLHVRSEARSERSFPFGFTNLRLRLTDGTFARVFDPERAGVLVRRTRLGAANLSYLHTGRGNHLPGGLPLHAQDALKDYVLDHLLASGTVRPQEPMEGYLVIDTFEALPSLDGAVLEAVTEDGGVTARDTFLFTRSGPVVKDDGARP